MAFTDTLTHLLPMAGSLAFGPIGGAVGTGVAGILGEMNANDDQKAFDNAKREVNPIDPMLSSHLTRLKGQEKLYRSGMDSSSGFSMRNIRDQGAQTATNLVRAGGPGTVSNLLRSQNVTNNAMANVGAKASGYANQILGMEGGIIGDISNRVYAEQKYKRGLAYAQLQNSRQDANNNLMAATGLFADALPQGIMGELPSFSGGGQNKSAQPFGGGTFGKGSAGGGFDIPRAALERNLNTYGL